MSGGARDWVARAWRPLLSELAATALLVLLGCMTLVGVAEASEGHLTRAALGFGGVILGLVQVFAPVSGAHMNPAVTLAAVLARRIAPGMAAAYALAQSAGALLGVAALAAVCPEHGDRAVTRPPEDGDPWRAALVEAAMTGLLALLCCSAWMKHDDTMPVKFGLLIAGLVYSGAPLSAASLNPARSLGPAIWYNSWEHHWVYWAGPLLGAALAAGLHRALVPPAPLPRRAADHEDVPLRDKGGEP